MTMTTTRAAGTALALWLSACGGDESDYATRTNPQYASWAVGRLVDIGRGVSAGNPDLASAGAFQLGGVVQLIITPVFEEEQALRLRPAPAPLVGTCACDAAGCRFEECAADDGSWTIDGDIAMSGERFTFDLAMTRRQASDSVTIDTDLRASGEVTIGESFVDGHVSGEIDTEQVIEDEDGESRVEGWLDWSMDVAQVSIDVNRCPLAGSVDAAVSAEAASAGHDADYSGSGTVLFGPACGDVAVAP
jgi:hypothetical protein